MYPRDFCFFELGLKKFDDSIISLFWGILNQPSRKNFFYERKVKLGGILPSSCAIIYDGITALNEKRKLIMMWVGSFLLTN